MSENGCVTFMNAGAELLFGISRKQVAGRRFTELLPGLEEIAPVIERAGVEDQSFGQVLTFSVPHQDRINVQVFCRIGSYHDGGDKLVIAELFDVTPWRQIDRERNLISQRGVSRRIIRQLAHEVRNPLGGLRGAAQLLERELPDPALKEYTDVIIGEVDRLAALTANLLGPAGKVELESVNVHELIERVLILIEGDAAEEIQIVRDYDPSLPDILVDRNRIIQALLNIARNAIQALGDRGIFTVRTRALTNYAIDNVRHRLVVSVEFEDNGPGVPEEIADSIFYPLVTGHDDGTGIGLPLAQDLVSQHGGLIECDSEPGRTVFMVRIPVIA
jgi:two-component system nitrogen regulation sensor histidine kinase GlnL